jgi:GNAT superfamily N-acetyltransferase
MEMRPLGRPGDLGWVVMAHGEVYAREFGWDASFEALVARIVADYAADHDATREAAWIAELDGWRMGCVFCVAADEQTAQLRILLVHPDSRGHRLGTRLTQQCIDFARAAGYRRLRLWTNHPLVAARSIYLAAGFTLVEEEHHHSFGVDLVGQVYELDLRKHARVADTCDNAAAYIPSRGSRPPRTSSAHADARPLHVGPAVTTRDAAQRALGPDLSACADAGWP